MFTYFMGKGAAAGGSTLWTYGDLIDLTNSGADDTTAWTLLSGLSGVTDIEVIMHNGGLDDNDEIALHIGDAGGFETTDYGMSITIDSGSDHDTRGFTADENTKGVNTAAYFAVYRLIHMSNNIWIAVTTGGRHNGSATRTGFGTKTLDTELTQIQISTCDGTASFDNGTARARWM